MERFNPIALKLAKARAAFEVSRMREQQKHAIVEAHLRTQFYELYTKALPKEKHLRLVK